MWEFYQRLANELNVCSQYTHHDLAAAFDMFVKRSSLRDAPGKVKRMLDYSRTPGSEIPFEQVVDPDPFLLHVLDVLKEKIKLDVKFGNIHCTDQWLYAQKVIEVALVCIGKKLYGMMPSSGEYVSSEIWKNSLACAIAGREICIRKLPGVFSYVEPFAAGFFHNIGVFVEHLFLFDESFSRSVRLLRKDRPQQPVGKEKLCQTTHEKIGSDLAGIWQLGLVFRAVLGKHHQVSVPNRKTDVFRMMHVLKASDYLTFKMKIGYTDIRPSDESGYLESLQFLGISPKEIKQMGYDVLKEAAQWAENIQHIPASVSFLNGI